MKLRHLSFYLIACLLFACGKESKSYEELLTPLYTPEYATGFTIYSIEGQESTIIRITNPWQGASGVVMDTYVERNGEKAPEGFTGQVVKAGAERLVALSTTHVGMLEYLGYERRVVGVSGLQYLINDYLTDPKNGVVDLGEHIQFETLVGLHPDVVFCYGVSDAETLMTDKLEELGIPYIYSGAYLEPSALGKSEWVIMFAEILDQREKGISGFQQIVSNYQKALAIAANVPEEERPRVMLNTPFNDVWVLPATQSVTASLIRDAGAIPETGEKEAGDVSHIGMEEALEKLSKADYWIGLGMATSYKELPEVLRTHAKEIRPIQLDHLYNNNAIISEAGGTAYYQEGIVRPDLILKDLIEIFHPELQEHTLYFYRHIAVE